ncbi:MAG: RNA polymerase sigma factor [Planctomycetes bacterium]|nr:RNA polymerase sigma factor [Planctomycetota bacterium]
MAEARGDTLLIRKCLDGDVSAYSELVDRYSARIVNLAYMMIGNRHDAEDIAQEGFIRAYRGLGKFQQKAKFSSWLYQITLNLCKDYLKAKARTVKSLDDEQLMAMDPGTPEHASRRLLENELSEIMRVSIGKLPVPYRETFVLRHLQGLDYDEVSSITGVPADTVRVRAYRARELLRQSLSPNVDTFWREKAAKEKDGSKV